MISCIDFSFSTPSFFQKSLQVSSIVFFVVALIGALSAIVLYCHGVNAMATVYAVIATSFSLGIVALLRGLAFCLTPKE